MLARLPADKTFEQMERESEWFGDAVDHDPLILRETEGSA
jgi:hypothetical protein